MRFFIKKIYCILSCFLTYAAVAQTPTMVWSTFTDSMTCFSSPHLADLNNDGKLDIVVGGGSDGQQRNNTMSAFDGQTGTRLWGKYGWNQVFGSAHFADINNDSTPDAIMGGRRGQLNAIDGATGNFIWQFFPQGDTVDSQASGIYNFYCPQTVADQNNNGTLDLLVANGGNHDVPSFDTINRPIGNLMLIESSNGSLIAQAPMPDGRETYHSALVHDFGNGQEVIYGTGGETKSGYLYRAPLSAVRNGDLSSSTALAFAVKGFIAPATLVDLNLDGVMDMVAASFDAHIYAINGANNQLLWHRKIPNTETFSAPTIGRFTADYQPDVFLTIAAGIAPVYTQFIQLALDGSNGNAIWQDTLGLFQYNTGLAVDLTGDFIDEIIVSANTVTDGVYKYELLAIDLANNTQFSLNGGGQPGCNLASTPWIGDLDNDGMADLVYTHNRNASILQEPPISQTGFYTEWWRLNRPMPHTLGFGAYLGNDYDGKYTNPFAVCSNFMATITANPVSCFGNNDGSLNLHVYNGQSLYNYTVDSISYPPLASAIFVRNGLAAGSYPIHIIDSRGCFVADTALITEPTELLATTTNLSLPNGTNSDGSFSIVASGGTPPYLYAWTGQTPTANSNASNLPAANYTISVTDANACVAISSVALFATALNSPTSTAKWQLLPNPTQQYLHLTAPTNLTHVGAQCALYNALGQLCWSQTLDAPTTTIDLGQLPSGTYIATITQNGEQYRQSLIIF